MSKQCTFCRLHNEEGVEIAGNELAFAFYDAFPSAPGHILVSPRRHVGHIRELSGEELGALFQLVQTLVASGDHNIGVNDGPLAGQTINHVHVHVVPRKSGDAEDPRGGVRWLFPDTANYWD